MKIYCCTPKNFHADEDSFFSRESGLFCRSLQSLGFESKSILLLPHYSLDSTDVLRGTYQELCNPAWWRALQLDGLILYSWAAPQFTAVAKAVHQAGIRSVIYMDTCGLVSRLGSPKSWWLYAWRPSWATSGNFFLKLYSFTKFLVDSVLLVTPRRRVRHLAYGHAITLPTRSGVMWMKREVSLLGRPDLAAKIFYSPHPQRKLFEYDGTIKENIILCVARFLPEDWPQKRPALLIESLNTFLRQNAGWKAFVVGRGSPQLAKALSLQPHKSIYFLGPLAHQELVKHYQKAKIGFWTSLWEGQQGAAAQALCCGCSIVAPASPLNNCFEDYVSLGGGRIVTEDDPKSFSRDLELEASCWQGDNRDPETISLAALKVFRADFVATRIIRLLEEKVP